MNRLLKPDMTLQNGAQSKRFAVSGSAVTKAAPSKAFQFTDRTAVKSYSGLRKFDAREFQTTTSPYQRAEAHLRPRNRLTEARTTYSTRGYAGVASHADSARTVNTSEYAEDTRSFLIHGKSQKSLSAQDRPLTLDQVRELLNKNK